VAAGVTLPKEGISDRISAGGYIVQLLPGATEDTIDMVELNIAKVLMQYNANGAAELLQKGVHPAQMVEELMTDLEPGKWTATTPRWWCKDCSSESVYAALQTLPVVDLQDILDTPEELEARCEWCCKDIELDREVLNEMIEAKS